jgi:hypothetical protein
MINGAFLIKGREILKSRNFILKGRKEGDNNNNK